MGCSLWGCRELDTTKQHTHTHTHTHRWSHGGTVHRVIVQSKVSRVQQPVPHPPYFDLKGAFCFVFFGGFLFVYLAAPYSGLWDLSSQTMD